MEIEKEVIAYLQEYGNTRESDLINYGVMKFIYSSEEMKKVIKRMAIEGKIHFIVHSKLEPPEVYISLKELLPPEIGKILLEAFVQMKTGEDDVKRILEEAASIAERKFE